MDDGIMMGEVTMFIFTVILPILFVVLSIMLMIIKIIDLDDDKINNLFRRIFGIKKEKNPLKRNTLDD